MSSKVKTRHVLMVRKLIKLCDTIFDDFFQGQFETLVKYKQEKKKVITTITAENGVSIINDNKAFEFFNQIYPKDNSKCGKLISAILEESENHYLLGEDELVKLASGLFYSWTCGEDYVLNLLEIGKLILKIDVHPNLHIYVEEARRCFALDRYLAVCTLSRTIIETFFLYLCELIKEEPEKDEYGYPKMGSVFSIVSLGDKNYKRKLYKLHGRASRIIHGDKMANRQKSKEIFQETVSLVQDVYHLHNF